MEIFFIILAILVGLFILFCIIIYAFGNLIRLKGIGLGKRYDDNGTLHYFSVNDFEGLKIRKTEFNNGKQNLQGYIYENEKVDKKAYIVLSHGLGAGHVQYMNEIAFFAKHGYQVFTYDVRGCYNSEGKSIGYFSNAILDLNAALEHINGLKEFNDRPIFLFGHSMGGYCVNNIGEFKGYNIKACVSLASFDNPFSLVDYFLRMSMGKASKLFVYGMKIDEILKNKKVAKLSSINSLKKVNYPVLLISGDKDGVVAPEENFYKFKKELSDKDNIKYLLVKDRYHRPNLSLKAAEYDQVVSQRISNFWKEKGKSVEQKEIKEFYDSFDYNLLVEFDDKVMNEIIEFYSNVKI